MTLLAILGVISSAIYSGTSLLYATLGEVVGERAGIVNLGLEGILLVSASTGVTVTSRTNNPYLGILAAVLAGGLMNLIFGYLVITRKANQLASGLATMFLGFGLSALIGKDVVGARIASLPKMLLPGLSSLPRLYSSLFKFDILIFLVIPVAFLIWWLLFRTRWGLGLRAVGENADIAFASGRSPLWFRYQALFISGMLAGLGSAHLAIAYTMAWTEYMTGGRGFIAVALVIFSKWHPLRAIVGALLFSGAVAFQLLMQASGMQVSPFLLDSREGGGLGLTTSQVGLAYGTFGILALTCGGLLGGFSAAKHGLKQMLPIMLCSMYLPKLAFVALSFFQPENFLIICGAVAVEQFGYGFGFTAFMLLLPLALTSTAWSIRRLGGRRWQRLRRSPLRLS